jgi:DNA-binding MarR family transcriptional regulator
MSVTATVKVAELTAATRRYQRETDAMDQALADRLGLNRTDLRCVDLLLEQPLSPKELADAAGLSQSAMTTALDRLERMGYARRVRDDPDRRRLRVHLTPELLALMGELVGPFAAEAAAEAERYSEAELELLTRFFASGSARRARHAHRIRLLGRADAPRRAGQ